MSLNLKCRNSFVLFALLGFSLSTAAWAAPLNLSWGPLSYADSESDLVTGIDQQSQLMAISTDLDKDQDALIAVLDQNGDLLGGRYVKTTPGQGPKTTAQFNVSDLRQDIVLLTMTKGPFTRDAIKLRAPGLDAHSGGETIVSVLREFGFISDDYRKLHVELRKDPKGWMMYTNEQGGRMAFNSLRVQALRSGRLAKGAGVIRTYLDGKEALTIDTANLEKD